VAAALGWGKGCCACDCNNGPAGRGGGLPALSLAKRSARHLSFSCRPAVSGRTAAATAAALGDGGGCCGPLAELAATVDSGGCCWSSCCCRTLGIAFAGGTVASTLRTGVTAACGSSTGSSSSAGISVRSTGSTKTAGLLTASGPPPVLPPTVASCARLIGAEAAGDAAPGDCSDLVRFSRCAEPPPVAAADVAAAAAAAATTFPPGWVSEPLAVWELGAPLLVAAGAVKRATGGSAPSLLYIAEFLNLSFSSCDFRSNSLDLRSKIAGEFLNLFFSSSDLRSKASALSFSLAGSIPAAPATAFKGCLTARFFTFAFTSSVFC